jgi:cytosine/adenosine deaminase-related metal-dependent hydrolase
MKDRKSEINLKKPETPIDPLEGPKLALAGQIVTMDSTRRILKKGTVFIEKGGIAALRSEGEPSPPGFEAVPVVDTQGTIFPGLVELHNHLSYDILQLWDVPKKYGNRGQWAGISEYQQLISGPMKLIGTIPGLMPAVIRFVECKCLLGGVTTSQGIELYSNKGARRFYRGIVRNVEQTDDPGLPEAATRIPDVEANDAEKFLARLGQKKCFLLHLAEGIDTAARSHFLSLEFRPGEWAVAESLAGIHCTALAKSDFDIMKDKGASMVWSPFSNLLLYGGTAEVVAAKEAGIRIGLGSDWSPSGSKNLLGELKVAHLFSKENGGIFSDEDIVALATTNAAAILQWQDRLGSIEAGKRADLLVIEGTPSDPCAALIRAAEHSIQLVMINGVARYGAPEIMSQLGASGEQLTVGGKKKVLYLVQKTADPVVAPISLKQAKVKLRKALKDLPNLKPPTVVPTGRAGFEPPLQWFLALDELAPTGMDVRPHLPMGGRPTMAAARGPVSRKAPVKLKPLKLDAMTVADDADFLTRVAAARNLPDYIKQGLPLLYA